MTMRFPKMGAVIAEKPRRRAGAIYQIKTRATFLVLTYAVPARKKAAGERDDCGIK